jgi:hypothetical protein
MHTVLRHKVGWKLLALLSTAMYVKPLTLGLLYPARVGALLFLGAILGLLWLASLFSYAFNIDLLPRRLWRLVALPSAAITAYSLASFLGYRATRLAIIDLNVAGVVFTLVEILVGTAFALAAMVPVVRLAKFREPAAPIDEAAATPV